MSGASVHFEGKWESQTFTSSGSFTVPNSVDAVYIELWGGGGSGASTGSGAVFGGEAGENFNGFVAVTPGASIAVTIGAGGAAPPLSAASQDGNDGGDSSFGSLIARGGRGGQFTAGTLTDPDFTKGIGSGRNSSRGAGGARDSSALGGDAGYGNGGDGGQGVGDPGEDGGIAAGGGGHQLDPANVQAGAGGNGICIVWYKEN